MSENVAEIMVDTLLNAGAKRCYGVVGDTINHLTEAIRHSDMDWVHVRHEEVGGFAAGGEAYITGELACCAGTCGPGSAHFLNGLLESARNGAPVVFIASQVDTAQMSIGFPQDVDQRPIYAQYSVFCEYVADAENAQRLTAIAAQKALNEGGLAVLIVPGNLFVAQPENTLPWRAMRFNPVMRPSDDELDAIVKALDAGNKVSIYAGHGCADAHDEVVALAEKLNAPVAWTSRAKDFIEYDNAFEVGMTGVFGLAGGYHAVSDCDTLLLLGCNFAWEQFYPDQATIIQIDKAAGKIGLRHPVDIGGVGTVRDTCAALTERVQPHAERAWLEKCRNAYQKALTQSDVESGNETLIHPQELTTALDTHADADAIFTADGGSPMVWCLRHIQSNGKRRTLVSLVHGTMANAYPQALGICQACPNRQVIAMSGDGGFAMLMGDILTLAQLEIPVKIVIFDNDALDFVELEQKAEGLLDAYTDLKNPDFGALAQAAGLWGRQVTVKHELDEAVSEFLAHDGPAVLSVKTNREELVMPPHIEFSQVASMALYSAKAVFSGRMGEVVDMVRNDFLER